MNRQTKTGNKTDPVMKYCAVCQKWEESERGWGTRPDGYSLHLSFSDLQLFIDAYWDRMPREVPDEYSRPDGTPYRCLIDEKTYIDLKSNEKKYGIWRSEKNYPAGDIDGWMNENNGSLYQMNIREMMRQDLLESEMACATLRNINTEQLREKYKDLPPE